MFHVKHIACFFPISLHCQTFEKKIPVMPAAIMTRNGLAPNQKGLQLQAQLLHRGNVSYIPYQRRSPHLGLSQRL